MNRRSEPCRNFQRGSCQYGDRCKFLHVTQPKSNPFGFGSHGSSHFSQNSQQPKPSPFGFGVRDSSQLSDATNFGSRNQSSAKNQPFQNKWIRPTAASNSVPTQHTDHKKQAAEHECMDPESCKRLMLEDFKNEAPLWKLTCYGHWKYLPCDIIGDFSFEELRSTAYEDAKRGLPLHSSVERERSMLNSKLTEFDNLLRNPYVIRSSGPTDVNQLSGSWNAAAAMSPLNNKPPTFSSFSQLGESATFAPSMSFGNQLRGTPSNAVLGQPSFPKIASQGSGVFEKYGTSVSFGGQPPLQQFHGSQGPSYSGTYSGQLPLQQFGSSTRPSNLGITNGFMAMGSEQPSLHSISPQLSNINVNHSPGFLDWATHGQSSVNQAPAVEKRDIGADDIIWTKEWDIGEIPEEAPPKSVCVDIKLQTSFR